MALEPKFTDAQIERYINQQFDRLIEATLLRLQRIGETALTYIRTSGNYNDRTGNLRSSTGYIILRNGLQHTISGFVQVKQGSAGIKISKKILEQAKTRFPTGLVLIIVAGMSYAAYVEAKGYDVLTGGSIIAEEALKVALQKLKRE